MLAPPSQDFAGAHDSAAVEIHPGRRWSLWDVMINFEISGLAQHLRTLETWEQRHKMQAQVYEAQLKYGNDIGATPHITDDVKVSFDGLLKHATRLADTLAIQGVHDRIQLFYERINVRMTHLEFAFEVSAIKDAFYSGVQYNNLYLYPRDKARLLKRFQADWKDSIISFPSSEADALAAVDCYALGQNTASVFHCMRVLECGLRALASNVSLTFDVQQWKNIIDEIETKIERMRDNGIPGLDKAAKDERLKFLSEAAKEFFYFKDGWRNYVSHARAAYDEYQARGALEHTRAFMGHLSTQLSE